MTTVAEFSTGPDEFPLGRLFEEFPDARIELERIVPTNDQIVPYFWLIDGLGAGLQRGIERISGLGVELIESVDGEVLMHAEWDPASREGILNGLIESNVDLIAATGSASGWEFEVRAKDRESIAGFVDYLADEGIPLQLRSFRQLANRKDRSDGLTQPQREGLALAYRRGYFDTPREVGLRDIADELDITPQALSSRLRRGTRHLVERMLQREEESRLAGRS
ncbi:MAG: helix-turn-helix domain-containing protein [Halobacteriales archaeon]|nr:helix-turn-helix domain-containing protein [Halobacteriales archaeon]